MTDRRDCSIDHNYAGTRATAKMDPAGLCWQCVIDRGYSVRRQLGTDFRGPLRYHDQTVTPTIVGYTTVRWGWTNAGFRGIEIFDGERVVNAGLVMLDG